MTHKIYVNGKVHVRRRKCETCIFRPGNLMHLEPGRRDEMVAKAEAVDGSIPCHSHIRRGADVEPVCKGFFDLHSTMTLRLAAALDIIEWVD